MSNFAISSLEVEVQSNASAIGVIKEEGLTGPESSEQNQVTVFNDATGKVLTNALSKFPPTDGTDRSILKTTLGSQLIWDTDRGLVNIKVFRDVGAAQTYTPSAEVDEVFVHVMGGGGGGGGVATTGIGSGGGAGGYLVVHVQGLSGVDAYTLTVGGGGAGGSSGTAYKGVDGSFSKIQFGDLHFTATGGIGGIQDTSLSGLAALGGAGGTVTVGGASAGFMYQMLQDADAPDGSPSMRISQSRALSGEGGYFPGVGKGGRSLSETPGVGNDGTGYGAGGGGGLQGNGANVGGVGSKGQIIIYEHSSGTAPSGVPIPPNPCGFIWVYGSIGRQNGWPRLTDDAGQPDRFPGTSLNGSLASRGNSIIAEDNNGTPTWYLDVPYVWWFKRGYNSAGPGTPMTPNVLPAGLGTTRDRFSYRFKFRAHQSADLSVQGAVAGVTGGGDRASNWVQLDNSPGGIEVRIYTQTPGAGWGGFFTTIQSGLQFDAWHDFEAVMTSDLVSAVDSWTYTINGVAVNTSNGYFSSVRDELNYAYETSSRIKFQPKNANYDAAFQGFYYDYMFVESWESTDKAGTLSEWCSNFEAGSLLPNIVLEPTSGYPEV